MAILSNERINELNTHLALYGITAELTDLYNIRFRRTDSDKVHYLANSFRTVPIAEEAIDTLIDGSAFVGKILNSHYRRPELRINANRVIEFESTKERTVVEISYNSAEKIVGISARVVLDLDIFTMCLEHSFLEIHSLNIKDKTRVKLNTGTCFVPLEDIDLTVDHLVRCLKEDRDAIGL